MAAPMATRPALAVAPTLRALALVALLLSATVPLALLITWSLSREWFYPELMPRAWTAESWLALTRGGPLARALAVSVSVGMVVGVVGCAAALIVGREITRITGPRRHLAVAATFLPLAAPPIAFGTGLQYSFIRLGLAGTLPGVALAHLVPAIGFLSLYFFAVFTAYDARIDEEARSLGATPWQVWTRVTLPLLRRPIAGAVALGFLLSWGQLALTLVIGGGNVHTLPLEVFGYVNSGQNQYAAAGALLLVGPPLIVLAILIGGGAAHVDAR